MNAVGALEHAPEVVVRRHGFWGGAARRLVRQPTTLAAFALLAAVVIVGVLAPVIYPGGWNIINLTDQWMNHPPTLVGHRLLGTDNIGRDMLARLVWAIHFSAESAALGGLAATVLALIAGLAAGYYGGWVDAALMRIADLVTGFPVLVLMFALFLLLRPVTTREATVVFALAAWPFAARVFRARIVSLSAEEFVLAARSLGASDLRIVLRHVVPNAIGTIVVSVTSLIGRIVLIEATVEFFGFGVLDRPTLGNLIGAAAASGIGPYNGAGLGWWTWAAPGVALTLLLACVNLIGDGLDAALDPRE